MAPYVDGRFGFSCVSIAVIRIWDREVFRAFVNLWLENALCCVLVSTHTLDLLVVHGADSTLCETV